MEGAFLPHAPPHHITAEETIRTCKDYELLVLFTSTPGFKGDIRIAEAIKDANPHIKIAFVGPHVSVLPEKSLMEASVIYVVCRKEFDYSIVEYAQGKPIEQILGISYRKNGKVVHNPDRPTIRDPIGGRVFPQPDQNQTKRCRQGDTNEELRIGGVERFRLCHHPDQCEGWNHEQTDDEDTE